MRDQLTNLTDGYGRFPDYKTDSGEAGPMEFRRRIWESVDRKSAQLWRRMECLREFTWQTVSRNGPVYNAGIQNGDVIVKIGEKNILSMKDYENQLEALHQGDTVTVTVQRKSVNEYKELEYQVNVGAR